MDTERGLGDDNVELEIHASYESLLEESGENQKKGILAPVPEKSKWELDESQVSAGDANQKQKGLTSAISPEFPVKVTREVIKRAENAIFKRAVNAIREPTKKSSGIIFNLKEKLGGKGFLKFFFDFRKRREEGKKGDSSA